MVSPVFARLSFLLRGLAGLGACLAALGADVSYFGVIKSHQFEQAPGQAPRLLTTNAFRFTAVVVAATNDAVTAACMEISPGIRTPQRLGLPPITSMTNPTIRLLEPVSVCS